jgi:hypothetical protein
MADRNRTAPTVARPSLARNPADALLGMIWFNKLTPTERGLWLTRAGSSVPADAWSLFKAIATGAK